LVTEDGGGELYGRFSLLGDNPSLLSALPSNQSTTEGETIAAVVALVLQIMPKFWEL
jgi:hypothetical protein